MYHFLHFAFKFVWLVSAVAFGTFVVDAYSTMNTVLPRAEYRATNTAQGMSVVIAGVDFQSVITVANKIADAHDKAVDELERSIRETAKTSFTLNVMCCIAALVGLFAQFGQYLLDRHTHQKQPAPLNHQ